MELGHIKAGQYEFLYNSLTTDVYVDADGSGWSIDIYKWKHYQGNLEVRTDGKLYITENISLNLEELGEYQIEVK